MKLIQAFSEKLIGSGRKSLEFMNLWMNFYDYFGLSVDSLGQVVQSVSEDLTMVKPARWLILGYFWPLLNWVAFLRQLRAVVKIGSSQKSKHQI